MGKAFIKIIFLIVLFIAVTSCDKSNLGVTELEFGEVRPGQTIEKTLSLNFNTEAVEDSSSYVEFIFLSESGERPLDIEYTIDSVVTRSNSFQFFAKDFVKKKEVKIGIRFPLGSPEKEYSGRLVINGASDALSKGISYSDNKLPIQIGECVGSWKAVYTDPMPIWMKLSIIAAIILIIVFSAYYILTRNNMPFGHKTFCAGMITFLDGESKVSFVRLDNLIKYDLSSALTWLNEKDLILEPYDKIHNRKKKRFAILKNNSDLNVQVIYDDGCEEMIGAVQELYHQDEIKILSKDNQTSLIRYSNSKIIRSN